MYLLKTTNKQIFLKLKETSWISLFHTSSWQLFKLTHWQALMNALGSSNTCAEATRAGQTAPIIDPSIAPITTGVTALCHFIVPVTRSTPIWNHSKVIVTKHEQWNFILRKIQSVLLVTARSKCFYFTSNNKAIYKFNFSATWLQQNPSLLPFIGHLRQELT